MAELLVVVNELATLEPTQSTAALIGALAVQGHAVWVCGVGDLSGTPTGLQVRARRWAGGVDALRAALPRALPARSLDGVWVRINPGRYRGSALAALQGLAQLADVGLPVRNAPAGLLSAASKTWLSLLPPETVPATWHSADPEVLAGFLDALGGPAVLKPASGTRGGGVVRVRPGEPGLSALLAAAVREGPALIQAYLPEAPEGDTRVHLVDGALFEVGGAACAARRLPGPGEWRSNVALGGRAAPAELTSAHLALVEAVGPALRGAGLWHVGLDVVGGKIVECNVFSPGGLGEAEAFTGAPFIDALARRFAETLG
ncbi:MAG: hypothetical protein JXX28_13605 [Deltaproteobacteria bacterium]|nr:hypothetical protein [Deltaproteobacteria bacterium]